MGACAQLEMLPYANKASIMSIETSKEVKESNDYMIQMLGAMDEITETSEKINRIIKAIDDIAFQTNILSLNAAVEAARAGASGKVLQLLQVRFAIWLNVLLKQQRILLSL